MPRKKQKTILKVTEADRVAAFSGPLITGQEAAVRLHVGLPSLATYVREGRLHKHLITGRLAMYSAFEVEQVRQDNLKRDGGQAPHRGRPRKFR